LYECVVPEDEEVRIGTNAEVPSPMWPAGAWPLWRPSSSKSSPSTPH